MSLQLIYDYIYPKAFFKAQKNICKNADILF